jgi:hypothetical protein
VRQARPFLRSRLSCTDEFQEPHFKTGIQDSAVARLDRAPQTGVLQRAILAVAGADTRRLYSRGDDGKRHDHHGVDLTAIPKTPAEPGVKGMLAVIGSIKPGVPQMTGS